MAHYAPLTVAAVNKFTEDGRVEEKRKHLGASVVGEKCARKVQFKWLWAGGEKFEARMLRLFNRGHREEAALIALLRGAGITVYDAGENGDLKAQMRITGHDGHFGGTPDGVGVGIPDLPPDEPALLEFKTHNDKLFQRVKAEGVYVANFKYYVQMQIYMHEHNLKWALYVGVNKNDDDLYMELVPYNHTIAIHYIDLAGQVIFAKTKLPKISNTPGWYECKFCPFTAQCHDRIAPAENCRTCMHASVGPNGTWLCGLSQPAIKEQTVCEYYSLNLKLFDDDIPF